MSTPSPSRTALAVGCMLLLAAPAAAFTIDFESFAIPSGSFATLDGQQIGPLTISLGLVADLDTLSRGYWSNFPYSGHQVGIGTLPNHFTMVVTDPNDTFGVESLYLALAYQYSTIADYSISGYLDANGTTPDFVLTGTAREVPNTPNLGDSLGPMDLITLNWTGLKKFSIDGSNFFDDIVVVPEPGTCALLVLGLAWLGARGSRLR